MTDCLLMFYYDCSQLQNQRRISSKAVFSGSYLLCRKARPIFAKWLYTEPQLKNVIFLSADSTYNCASFICKKNQICRKITSGNASLYSKLK